MKTLVTGFREWLLEIAEVWNRFWFTPAEPHTLAAIRILGGLMILYTHLVWAIDLKNFLGPDSWMNVEASRAYLADATGQSYVWTYLWYFESPLWLWTLHLAALTVMTLLVLGVFTRITSVLTWLITLAYCHRLEGALFGLDQVNAMLSMYLMVGACGDVYSLDHYWRSRTGNRTTPTPKVSTNVALRMIQVQMCVIYLFGGISKLRGFMWWDGSACWFAIANLEYQSLNVTWLIRWPWFIALLTHVTIFWETFYPVLVWPRLTRPIMLFLAVCVHGGIALLLGMKTFGLAMIIGNLAFVSPAAIRWCVAQISTNRTAVQSPPAAIEATTDPAAMTKKRKRHSRH